MALYPWRHDPRSSIAIPALLGLLKEPIDLELIIFSQIIAFVAYQVRVAASLALIAETP